MNKVQEIVDGLPNIESATQITTDSEITEAKIKSELEDFNKKLKVVQEFLDQRNQRYMLIGSGALLSCGIPLQRFCHDIDFEVIEDDDNANIYKMLQDATQGENEEYKYLKMDGKRMPFMFTYKGVKVNIWLVKKFNHEQYVWKNNMKVATVYSVLKKKMALRRVKDFQDLQYIVKTFMEL